MNRMDQTAMADWKALKVPFGEDAFEVRVPADCVTLRMKPMPNRVFSRSVILDALTHPIGSPGLPAILQGKNKPIENLRVCISVSDITRPVPYKGPDGILLPLLEMLQQEGVRPEHITIVIGNGMHRASTPAERLSMYGAEVVRQYRIVDHDCEDLSSQVLAAQTSKGTDVYLNRIFFDADVKIVTGLVESHFMAGVSGGRKGVCPALVNTKTIQKFHGPDFLEHPNAATLVLEGNPCHEESLEVALAVGVDFLVNTTLDHQLNLNGVFAGDLVKAHLAAVEAMKEFVRIPIDDPFDIVLTHGGYVGRNHYQCAKAAVCAMPVVKENGMIILAANNSDPEPVGSPEYKTLLHLLKVLGPDRYVSILRHPDWVFTKDQWEPEMWAKPIRKVGAEGLIICAPQLLAQDFEIIPGVSGDEFIDQEARFASGIDKAATQFQNAVAAAVASPRFKGRKPSIAFIEDGPYAVPMRV